MNPPRLLKGRKFEIAPTFHPKYVTFGDLRLKDTYFQKENF